MTMENPENKDTDRQPQNGQAAGPSPLRNPSRRRFTRAGVGASAVILTLTSRSVLAQTTACTTPSGFASANLSRQNSDPVLCEGVTASSWLSPDRKWPVPRDTKFSEIFGSSSLALRTGSPQKFNEAPFQSQANKKDSSGQTKSTSLNEATLFDALNGTETPAVVKYIIAGYLNFRAGLNSYPTDLQVIAIFKEWQATNGYYTPSAGIKWGEKEIIGYLGATQGELYTPPGKLG